MINIKVGPELRTATKKQAGQQFISMPVATEQGIEKLLMDHGIERREEDRRSSIHAIST